jgi:hypothetical protein
MAEPQNIDDLEFLVDRIGMPTVHQQAGFEQRTVDFSMPMELDELEPEVGSGRASRPVKIERGKRGVDVVNVMVGGFSGMGTYSDGGSRPQGSGRPKVQGRKKPVLWAATQKYFLAETDIADGGEDSIDSVMDGLETFGSQAGAYLARSLNDPAVDEPAADVAAGATSMTVQDMSGYIEGQSYEVRLDSDDSRVGTFVAALVAPAFDGTAVVTFEEALTFTIDVSEHSIYLLGQGDPDKAFGSIKDATDSTLDMYGLSRTTEFPAGILEDVNGVWSNADGKRAVSMLKTSDMPSHWLTSPIGSDKIVTAQDDNVRFIPGQGANNRDPFHDAMIPEFCGLPIIDCPQAGDETIVLGNFKRIKLREHAVFRPRMPSGRAKGDMGKASLFTSEDGLCLKQLWDGFYSTIITRRRSFLRFTRVTG